MATRLYKCMETVRVADAGAQEARMFSTFTKLATDIRSAEDDEFVVWSKLSLITQAVVDACMRSIAEDGKEVTIAY